MGPGGDARGNRQHRPQLELRARLGSSTPRPKSCDDRLFRSGQFSRPRCSTRSRTAGLPRPRSARTLENRLSGPLAVLARTLARLSDSRTADPQTRFSFTCAPHRPTRSAQNPPSIQLRALRFSYTPIAHGSSTRAARLPLPATSPAPRNEGSPRTGPAMTPRPTALRPPPSRNAVPKPAACWRMRASTATRCARTRASRSPKRPAVPPSATSRRRDASMDRSRLSARAAIWAGASTRRSVNEPCATASRTRRSCRWRSRPRRPRQQAAEQHEPTEPDQLGAAGRVRILGRCGGRRSRPGWRDSEGSARPSAGIRVARLPSSKRPV
jgi:hypothetical protein